MTPLLNASATYLLIGIRSDNMYFNRQWRLPLSKFTNINKVYIGSKGFHFWWITDEMTRTAAAMTISATLSSLFTGRAHYDELNDAVDI